MSKKIIVILIPIIILASIVVYFKFYFKPYEISPSGLIRITTPRANENVQSPLVVKGEAKGYWFFEASFPVKVLDENDKVLGFGIARSQNRLDDRRLRALRSHNRV